MKDGMKLEETADAASLESFAMVNEIQSEYIEAQMDHIMRLHAGIREMIGQSRRKFDSGMDAFMSDMEERMKNLEARLYDMERWMKSIKEDANL